MKQITVALAMLCIAINTTAQIAFNATARCYLPTASTFSQGQIDSFNSTVNYQNDITNGLALTYPDLTPIQLTWNGQTWEAPQPVAITNGFTTPLMVGAISHTATATAGALYPNVVIDWSDVPGVTQYRHRFRPIGGTWVASTITGSQRTMGVLAFNTTYECQVRVYISASVQGEYTQTYTFTTPPEVPLPTCNAPVATKTKFADSLRLTWASVPNATSYFVQCRELNTLVWGGFSVNGTKAVIPTLPNTAYQWQVRSNCTGTQTALSQFTNIDTATDALCQPPTNLAYSNGNFTWTEPKYGNTYFLQLRKVGTTKWGGLTLSGTTFTNNSLSAGNYEWRVRSRCYATTNADWTLFSDIATFTIGGANIFEPTYSEQAYPNPCDNVVKYNGDIVIRDITGRILATGENEVDTHQLPNGLYFINGQKLVVSHK